VAAKERSRTLFPNDSLLGQPRKLSMETSVMLNQQRETLDIAMAIFKVVELLKKNRKKGLTQSQLENELNFDFNKKFIKDLKKSPKIGIRLVVCQLERSSLCSLARFHQREIQLQIFVRHSLFPFRDIR
jgi:hypothetical protein